MQCSCVSSTFTTNYIQAQISINGNTSLAINNPQQIVAFVQKGLIANVQNTQFGFLQCNAQNAGLGGPFTTGTGTSLTNFGSLLTTPSYRFTEGFASSWKAKNIAHIINNTVGSTTGNGTLTSGASYWSWSGSRNYPGDLNQNVPGAIYNTESGFEYVPAQADPAPNPPLGVGTVPVTATTAALNSTGAINTGISGAGVASQGTRLALQISGIPNGSVVLVPTAVNFVNTSNVAGPATGTMVLVNTDANGAGAYSPVATAPSTTSFVQVASSGLIVYEVVFADPFSIERADVPVVVAFAANLAQNLPQPGVTAQAAGSFAPFYTTAAAHNPSSTLPVPRFVPGLVPANLFSINKCACNLLFPYVASTAGYDTGIAIANTSLDPGATFGFFGTPQSGGIQFWYYGTGNNGAAPPPTQCTNSAAPGTCPATTSVPAGQVLTYVVSSGGGSIGTGPNGLDNRGAGFVGYVIAQAGFQYCHAFAYIGALGAGPLSTGISEGYLGLILDNSSINCPGGLCRTLQAGENLVH